MLDNASLRRLLVTLCAPLFVLLSKRFGIDIDPGTQEMLVGLAIAYVLGSNAKEAVVAKAAAAGVQAAATIATPADAAKALSGEVKP